MQWSRKQFHVGGGASSDLRCLAREGGGGGYRRDFESKFNLVATDTVMQFAKFMHAGVVVSDDLPSK